MMRRSWKLLPLLLLALLMLSCRKWPDNPQSTDTSLQGFYVGIANIGGGYTNVLVEVLTADSLGNLKGTIIYRSDTCTFTEITTNSAKDTLWFKYTRESTAYQAWAKITNVSMTVNITTPTGIPAFRLNKEISNYNMSGLWTGLMSSTLYQNSYNSDMTMDQAGSLFSGTIVVSFPQQQTYTLRSGAVSQSGFQISGTLGTSSTGTAVIFEGSYQNVDRVGGYWHLDDMSDQGQFLFIRSF
jgi:hypothetical protein